MGTNDSECHMTDEQVISMFTKVNAIAKEYGMSSCGRGHLGTMRWYFSFFDPAIDDEICPSDIWLSTN